MTLRMVDAAFVLQHPTLQGVTLPSSELAKIPGYIADASALIEDTFSAPTPTHRITRRRSTQYPRPPAPYAAGWWPAC